VLPAAKHQLRVHTADCLNCPILGDHKYSSFGKLAPQQLPGKILRRFGLPRTKTRYIPLHLFHSSILIPGDAFWHLVHFYTFDWGQYRRVVKQTLLGVANVFGEVLLVTLLLGGKHLWQRS